MTTATPDAAAAGAPIRSESDASSACAILDATPIVGLFSPRSTLDSIARLTDDCDEDGHTLDELPAAVPLAGDNLRLSVNAFFVTDGTRPVLIDTGASNAWHDPTMGLIYDALDEAGIDRADVTDVAITHKHEDHVSGLIAPDGSEAFTELERVWIGAGDTSVFTGRLEPIRDRVVTVSEKVAINDWTTAIPTPGHAPGHTVYDVGSGAGQSQARAARAALLEQLTRPHHFVAGAHLDSPGIARVTPSGDGYALEYLAPPIG